MITAYIQTIRFSPSATPWLIICAKNDGKRICPTADSNTSKNN